jgi:hypothetical protein
MRKALGERAAVMKTFAMFTRPLLLYVTVVVLYLLVFSRSTVAEVNPNTPPLDLRMNQIQVVGTHNSYHVASPQNYFQQVARSVTKEVEAWDYTHAPLEVQLDRGVRSLELDVYADPQGIRVCHVPLYDPGTHCERLKECLEIIKRWSLAHRKHVPIIVLLEIKDEPIPLAQVQPFDKPALDQLDTEIRAVFDSADLLLMPDEVRKDAPTLSEGIQRYGWPLLDQVRGRTMFVLHAYEPHRSLYVNGDPALRGRAMFVQSDEGDAYASFFILNDPTDPKIPRLVKAGYMVRTRADSGLKEAMRGTERRDAAFASGAQVIHTDFPPGEAHPKTGYVVAIKEGAVRYNPVLVPSATPSVPLEPEIHTAE